MNVKNDSILLNTRRTAEMIGCSVQALRNWHLCGRLPVPIQIGNRLFWKRTEIIRWVDAGCPSRNEWKKYSSKSDKFDNNVHKSP